jgi:hypothetical protein
MDNVSKAFVRLMGPVLFLALFAGCAPGGAIDSDPFPREADGEEEVFTLHVDNDSFQDARVQLLWNGSGPMLGRVRASTSESFQVRLQDQRFRLRIDFVAGGRRYDSDPMPVQAGQELRYRIDG